MAMASAPDSPEIINELIDDEQSSSITNAYILQLSEQHEDEKMLEILHSIDSSYKTCNQNSLRKKIEEIKKKFKDFKNRKKTKKLSEFSKKLFSAPSVKNDPPASSSAAAEVVILKETLHITQSALQQTRSLHNQAMNVAFSDEKALKRKCKALEHNVKKAATECEQLQSKYNSLKEKSDQLSTRNVNKRIKRRDQKIIALTLENNELKSTANLYDLKTLKDEKLALMKSKSQIKLRSKRLLLERENDISRLKLENKKQKEEISNLEVMVGFLEGESVPSKVSALNDGRYTNAVREACMILLTECNVSFKSLPKAIEVILSKIGGISIDQLPSAGTLSKFMTEAGIIASAHIGTEMLQDFDATSMTGNVLHQDATTKFHKHYQGMQVTLKDGQTLSMGLRHVAGGTADDYKRCLDETLEDIAAACTSDENTKPKLQASFKAFMNDRAAVNKTLTSAIRKERDEILPSVIPNYSSLPEDQLTNIHEMGHFSCRMHLLANLGGAAEKGISFYEDAVAEGTNPHAFTSEDCGTLRMVRASAKALTHRGDDKSGVSSYFSSFLGTKGEQNHIVPFEGHRFNILFYDAAAVYYHENDIKQFLSSWPKPNRLLDTVKFDIKEPIYLAGIRALGIIFKLLTGPFQSLLNTNKTILQLNRHLHIIQQTLHSWANDGSQLLKGEQIDAEMPVIKDPLYEKLFRHHSPEMDSLTVLAIEQASAEMVVLFERQADEQLPGGSLYEPSSNIQQLAKNVPCSNVVSERDMAKLDNLIRQKPSAKVEHIETCSIAQSNKPFSWLDSLSAAEKDQHLSNARRTAKARRDIINNRHLQLKADLANRLAMKEVEKATSEARSQASKVQLVKDVHNLGGLWEVDDIDTKINHLRPAEARQAILKQLRFYRTILNVKGPRQLFQESSSGQQYSVEKMAEHLRTVINSNTGTGMSTTSITPQIVIRENYLDQLQQRKRELFCTLQEARKSRKAKGQIQTLLPALIDNPNGLVGCHILHKCKDGNDIDWFEGTVVDIYKHCKDATKTEFNISYKSSAETWHFPLLIDLKKGDLIVLQ